MSKPRSPSRYFATSGRERSGGSQSHLISVRLADELLQRLAAVGNEEGLALSDTIRLVLERGLAARKTPRSET
jgi:hypothetical protein